MQKYIEKYKIIIDKYLNFKVKEFGYEIERVDIFRRLFFELNAKENLEELISFLITVDELKEYFVDYKENNNDINFDLENEIKNILSSSEFFNLLITILKSKSIKNFFCHKINFSKDMYGTEKINDNIINADLDFKNAYEIFMGKIIGQQDWF